MSGAQISHSKAALTQWDRFQQLLGCSEQAISIDGRSIDIPSLVAIARHDIKVNLHQSCMPLIENSFAYCTRCLAEGHSIYGVNTGFGGSADTRTDKTAELQVSLIGFLNCGVVTYGDSPCSDATSLPEAWVRASIVVRANSLARGHSGVRLSVIGGLVDLLNHNIIPAIPLRGSISASGDLIPLSYIAGALQGRRGIKVWIDRRFDLVMSPLLKTDPVPESEPLDNARSSASGTSSTTTLNQLPRGGSSRSQQPQRQIIGANEALSQYNLKPLTLEPKEGLSLVNGTALSAGTGAIAMFEAQGLALLSQVLTAMSVEAFIGTAESFEPFIARVRPHVGQIEAARNIRCFLKGSRLAQEGGKTELQDEGGLRQDRYSLRTTPQWIGPQLENLTLACEQVEIECNSTTDNPILDTDKGSVLHGGNFQALAVTSAMEKVRQSIQQIGRMLFVQCSELINPDFNNGLPPNLEAGEPSQGFLAKGIDISAASLCSELGFLANPIIPHVQTAEMGNQSLNSLAFISARYTHSAIDVFSQLAAAHLFVLCQALDLRCVQRMFLESFQPKLDALTNATLAKHFRANTLCRLQKQIWSRFCIEYCRTTSQDTVERFHNIFKSLQPEILSTPELEDAANLVGSLTEWTSFAAAEALTLYRYCMIGYMVQPVAKRYLSSASLRIWDYVRSELMVPFHAGKNGFWNPLHKDEDASIGEMITKIYLAIKEGGLIGVVMECVREAHTTLEKEHSKL